MSFSESHASDFRDSAFLAVVCPVVEEEKSSKDNNPPGKKHVYEVCDDRVVFEESYDFFHEIIILLHKGSEK